jgi:hypothetical protein
MDMTATPEVERPDLDPAEPPAGDPAEAEREPEFGSGAEVVDIDDDPDTSILLCLQFHLMSEHQLPHALHLDDEEAETMHAGLHDAGDLAHDEDDHRCRPGRALMFLMNAIHDEHEILISGTP